MSRNKMSHVLCLAVLLNTVVLVLGSCQFSSDEGFTSGKEAPKNMSSAEGKSVSFASGQKDDTDKLNEATSPSQYQEAHIGGLVRTSKGVEILRKTIGEGLDQIGFQTPPEAMSIGPISFAIGEDEVIYVLDLANNRIQVYKDNSWLRSLPLPYEHTSFTDLEVTQDGNVLVLDHMGQEAVLVIDGAHGKMIRKINLGAYARETSGIYFRPHGPFGGVWASVGQDSIRLAYPNCSPDPKGIMVPGRLNFKGDRTISTSIIGDATVMVYRSSDRFSEFQEDEVVFDAFVVQITAVDMDDEGNAYLVVFLEHDDITVDVGVVLNEKGEEIKRFKLQPQVREADIFHPIKIDKRGKIYQLIVEDEAVVIRRYDP